MTAQRSADPGPTMPVVVSLPPALWWALSGLAEARGVPVARILEVAAERLLRSTPTGSTETAEASIADMWARGLSDREMAAELDMTNAAVQRIRAEVLHLPANRKPR